MLLVKLPQKERATSPVGLRKQLDLHSGNKISFTIKSNQVIIIKTQSFNAEYHRALTGTLNERNTTPKNKKQTIALFKKIYTFKEK